MSNNLFPIAKEGWNYVIYSFLAFLVLWFLDLEFLQFFAFLAILFFLFIYRNPERQMPSFEKGGIVSPVDGIVTSIKEIQNDEYSHKISIESAYFDVSILRSPIEAKIVNIDISRGASLAKSSNLSNKLNENIEFVFENSNLNKIKISHQNILSFDEIKFDVFVGKKLIQGARYGVLPKGITNIYLPKNTKTNLIVGVKLKACESLIGYLY